MRRLLVALVLGLLLASPAAAGEAYDIAVRANHAGDVVVVLGDLHGRPLTPVVIATLSFLVAWAKTGQPTAPVTLQAAPIVLPIRLRLPIVGVTVDADDARTARVRLDRLTVLAEPTYTSSAVLTLDRASSDAPWVVTLVAVQ